MLPTAIRLVLWLFGILVFLILIVMPAITGYFARRPTGFPPEFLPMLDHVQTAQHWLLRTFVVMWIFFLGGCFASFLNVVAWRLPQGRGILGSSKCPFCNNKLQFTANLPIYGWLSSGGRCRSCKLPIPPRYLYVEIFLGLAFLSLAIVGFFCGGVYLPLRPVDPKWGLEQFMYEPKTDLIQIVVFHLTLICLVFVGALVRLERKQYPVSVFVFGILIAIAMQCFWPWTQQASWPTPEWPLTLGSPQFWISMAMGIVVGYVCAFLIRASYQNREPRIGLVHRECIASLVCIGLFLGFQFAISITLLVLLLDALLVVIGDSRSTLFWTAPVFKIGLFLIAGLLMWNLISQFEWWPGPFSSPTTLAVWLGLAFLLSVCVGSYRIEFKQKQTDI